MTRGSGRILEAGETCWFQVMTGTDGPWIRNPDPRGETCWLRWCSGTDGPWIRRILEVGRNVLVEMDHGIDDHGSVGSLKRAKCVGFRYR